MVACCPSPCWRWRWRSSRRRVRRPRRPRPAAQAAPGGPGALSHFDLARKDCLGTARNRTLEGLVHRRRRRAVRRLLPDHRQHQRRDHAVRRHRRADVHRPADPRHDLHRAVDRRERDGLPGHEHREERQVPAGHRLRDRPGPGRRGGPHPARAGHGRAGTSSCTSGTTRRSTATAGAGRDNGGADDADGRRRHHAPWSAPTPTP